MSIPTAISDPATCRLDATEHAHVHGAKCNEYFNGVNGTTLLALCDPDQFKTKNARK
jgi:hypothetical protein